MLVYIPHSGRVLIPETESTHGSLDASSSVTDTRSRELVFTHVPVSWFSHTFQLAGFHTRSRELVFTHVPVSWFSHTFFFARAFTQVSVKLSFLTTGNTWNFTKF